MLDLSNPNAPTRVSGFWRVPLSLWARARNARLPDRGGAAPYKGRFFIVGGALGGTPNPLPPINAAAGKVPVPVVPAGVAARAEVLRRQLYRERIKREAQPVALALTPGGLDFAKAPRLRTRTPSLVRGTLRDNRRPPGGIQYFDHEQAPTSVVNAYTRSRILANPRAWTKPGTFEEVDGAAQADRRAGQALAMKSASVANPDQVTPVKAASPLPLLAVAAVFFLVFRR